MKPYSVLLLYPDYLRATDWESYYTHITADSTDAARMAAQQEAAVKNFIDTPQDFVPLIVLSGHIEAEMTSWDL